MLSVFQIITKDGWTLIMYNLMDASTPRISSFYISLLIWVGSFFLLNLILAVIMNKFTTI